MPSDPTSPPGGASAARTVDQLFGLAAEFDTPEAILAAAKNVHERGYTRAEAYTPFPVSGLCEELGSRHTRVPMIVLCGAMIGAGGAFFMQWFANTIHLPWNIGGRPMNSWPAFIPITFEGAILVASIVGVAGMLLLNKLPQPYHPMFRAHDFERATRDRFFLCIETNDPAFDLSRTRQLLEEQNPLAVMEVPK